MNRNRGSCTLAQRWLGGQAARRTPIELGVGEQTQFLERGVGHAVGLVEEKDSVRVERASSSSSAVAVCAVERRIGVL